ncbi:hypothetical protein [Croceicoccus estronivorus]|uniref:hypothetical protein n=1 Tax=Croceicoccus estronivorus TaxID=1172626 RepID=UPI0012E7BC58|nr:hypothetical protein [Croceicoccus estronivorus]
MIGTLLALLSLQATASGDPAVIRLDGRCQYPEAVARYRYETTLVLCDSLAIGSEGDETVLDFSRQSWGSMIRISGRMSGARMTIDHIYFRERPAVEATGTCEIFYRGGKVSLVSCLAKAGSRTYATNFVVSRL